MTLEKLVEVKHFGPEKMSTLKEQQLNAKSLIKNMPSMSNSL